MKKPLKKSVIGFNLIDFLSSSCKSSLQKDKKIGSDSIQTLVPNCFSSPPNKSSEPFYGSDAINLSAGNSVWLPDLSSSGIQHASKMNSMFSYSRTPGWLIWDELKNEKSNSSFLIKSSTGKNKSLKAAQLLKASFKYFRGKRKGDNYLNVVAMPDSYSEVHQETLLRSIGSPRSETRLLWRSIAAYLGCITGIDGERKEKHKELESVLVMDIQNSYIECVILNLAKNKENQTGQFSKLPVKQRKSEKTYFYEDHQNVDLDIMEHILAASNIRKDEVNLPNMAWGKNGIFDILTSKRNSTEETLVRTANGWKRLIDNDKIEGIILYYIEGRLSSINPTGLGDTRLPELLNYQGTMTKFREWFSTLHNRPRHVVITGSVPQFSHFTTNELLWKSLQLQLPSDLEILNRDFISSDDLISKGCSVWGSLDLMELPGYYEYLPEFHLIGKDEVAEDIYLNLVKGDDETGLVTGGKTYRNDSLKNIAKLPVGEKEVTFKFRKDSKVKQIKQKFNLPETGDVFLSFKVKLIPSQGYAEIEITPSELMKSEKNKPIFLEWDRLVDFVKSDKDELLSFPPSSGIEGESAPDLWEISQFVNYNYKNYDEVCKKYQNGRLLGSSPEVNSNKVLKKFIRLLKDNFDLANSGYFQKNSILRTASILHDSTPRWAVDELRKYLFKVYRESPDNPNPTEVVLLNSMGRCFAKKTEISLFVKCFITRFDFMIEKASRSSAVNSLAMNNWCKAFQLILRTKNKAVLYIKQEDAYKLLEKLLHLLNFEKQKNQHGWEPTRPTQNSLLCIFYLLRVRATENGRSFLSKGHEETKKTIFTIGGSRPWKPSGMDLGDAETLQSSLTKLIKQKATLRDIIIIQKGEKEISD